jgi:hypothetical protein
VRFYLKNIYDWLHGLHEVRRLHLIYSHTYGNILGVNQPLGANRANQTHSMTWEGFFKNILGEVEGLF